MSTASCDSNCTPAACGDGFVNAQAFEQCDPGNPNQASCCSATCTVVTPPCNA
jgi:cysteine-rich repeat protein